MKTLKLLTVLFYVTLLSCGKENRWEIELPEEKVELKFTDISKDFFDQNIPLTELKSSYPFFFDDSKDEIWEEQRKDTLENTIYNSVNKVFVKASYKDELQKLFSYYKYYFPNEALPDIYTYSSGLQRIYNPVIFSRKERGLFIAMDGFLGSNSQWYQQERVYPYLADNMNLQNIAPKVVEAIGLEIVPFNPRQQSFIDIMVDEGKKLILADALLPETSDALKIGYSPKHLQWAIANEGDTWNYFVEQNMVFDTDKSYRERFINPAPFSKFLNEIETDSPGRIGAWVGWQICRKYLDENPDVTLEQFINEDTQLIFKESKYKPKKGEGNYAQTKQSSNDEVKKYDN